MKNRLHFYKYQGAGNDFVVADNRQGHFSNLDFKQIALICDRRFGIGADGFMLLENHPEHAFCMRFFNSDGMPGSMCGNGGRCIVAFALKSGLIRENEPVVFWSSDGEHQATVLSRHGDQCMVRLKMRDVDFYACDTDMRTFLIDTGSPHYVSFRDNCQNTDVTGEGKRIRFSSDFPEGTNVDFVEKDGEGLIVRTYERGVEDETFSCGTGATASAMAMALKEHFPEGRHRIGVSTKGGQLQVDFLSGKRTGIDPVAPHAFATLPEGFHAPRDHGFCQVYLEGLATFVFEADLEIDL